MNAMRVRRERGRTRRAALGAALGLAAAAAAVGLAAQGGTEADAAGGEVADTVFVNGRVMLFPRGDGSPAALMAPTLDWARAVAVTDGKISYVGDDDGARKQVGAGTKIVDLQNKLLMPGLGDGHLHGGNTPMCDLDYEGGTIDTVLGKLKACLQREDQTRYLTSNATLSARNLMGDGLLPSGVRLDRHVLDRLSRDPADDPFGTGTTRPIVVSNMDGHKTYTNTKAIENGGIDASTPDPTDGFIGRDPDGYPNGQFADYSPPRPFGDSIPTAPDASYLGKIDNYQYANSLGITTLMHPGGSASSAALVKRIADAGKLTVRVNQALSGGSVRGVTDPAALRTIIDNLDRTRAQYDGYKSDASPGTIAIDTVKIFCDGVPEFPGQTAAMLRPYRRNVGTAENPVWVPGTWRGEEPSCEDATDGFVALDDDRWNIHVHSLGDRSTRVTLDNYEAAERRNASWDRRHAITHLEFVDDRDLARFGQLGVVASMTGQWAQRDGWSVDGIVGYVEPDRMDNMYPSRDIIAGGGVVAQGSDWPVTNLLPWAAIEQFVTREGQVNPAKAIYPGTLNGIGGIELAQAYRASTIGVAYQLHEEGVTGSIEVGKYADMIVVDADPFWIAGVSDQLADARRGLAEAQQRIGGERAAADADAQALTLARGTHETAERARATAGTAARGAAKKAATARRAAIRANRRLAAARKAYKKSRGAKRRAAVTKAKRAAATGKRRLASARRAKTTADRRLRSARAAAARTAEALRQADAKAAASARAAAATATSIGELTAKVDQLGAAEADAKRAAVAAISDTKVLMTMVGGQTVYAAADNPLGVTRE